MSIHTPFTQTNQAHILPHPLPFMCTYTHVSTYRLRVIYEYI